MSFAKKMQNLMTSLNLTQAQVADLTGINRSSISQYCSGEHEPTKARQREIAHALGVREDYFDVFNAKAVIQQNDVFNLPVGVAAKLMKKSKGWVEKGLQDGVFPWGYGIKLKEWSYYISSKKFTEWTGIEIPDDVIGG